VTIHNEYAQENPRINQQDRQKITFPGSAYPKEIPQQCTPTTQREAVHHQRVLLGVFHPCLWLLKAPGSTLGEGRQASRQSADATTCMICWLDICYPLKSPKVIACSTSCVRGCTICPRPCTPYAAAQLQPIHALRLRHSARLAPWIFIIDRQRLTLVMITVSAI